MENPLKRGMEDDQKIRSNIKLQRLLRLLPVFLALLISTLACSNGYLTEAELAATAQITMPATHPKENKTPEAVRLVFTPTEIPQTPTENQTPESIPSTDIPDLWVDQPVPSEVPTGTAAVEPEDTVPAVTPSPESTSVETIVESEITPNVESTLLPVFPTQVPLPDSAEKPPILYYTQAGDTLPSVAVRFGVAVKDITSEKKVSPTGFLDPNQLLVIPPVLSNTTTNTKLIPDSETVFSPSGLDLDVDAFVKDAGGYLSTYREYLGSTGWETGAEVIKRIAYENSINPRLLLSVLEYKSHWVYGHPSDYNTLNYPMGHIDSLKKGLYQQLAWAISNVSEGYYGWREGRLTDIPFTDGSSIRAAPELNAGTVAVQFLFAQLYSRDQWEEALYGQNSFSKLHEKMFGSPWLRAQIVEPLFPATLTQPDLILPFEYDKEWSLTGGPHSSWGLQGAMGALDFSPASSISGCYVSDEWAIAAASGIVVRSGNGVVMLDLDGDGNEQTGWNLLYMHIAARDRPPVGKWIEQGEKVGHPSCEGGLATGTHFHIARKYNGEWIIADGPIPFNLGGWIAHAGAAAYQGTMTRGSDMITASVVGVKASVLHRLAEVP
jgi:LysM repeat protein